MKKKLLALAIGAILSASAQAALSNIIISEYVKGTGYDNTALELTNTGSDTYTFTDGAIQLKYSSHNNQVQNSSGDNILTGLSIPAGKTLVIYNGKMDAANVAAISGQKIASLNFNTLDSHKFNHLGFSGDDQVALMQGTAILDVIGVNGRVWGDLKTFRRRVANGAAIPAQSPSYETSQWAEFQDNTDPANLDAVYADLGTSTYYPYVAAVTSTIVDLQMIPEDGGSFHKTLARYVGQTVRLPADITTTEDGDQDMRVTRTFSFDYSNFRNNMVLSYKRPNLHPNQENAAGSAEAIATAAQNADYSLLIESQTKAKDGDIPYYPDFSADPANNYIRIDDSVVGLEGMISENWDGSYTFTVSNTATSSNFKHNTPRMDGKALAKSLADVADGDIEIKVATQNVLNYFNSPFGGAQNNHGENRGATSYSEYDKQKAKIVASIRGLDADIVGLMEIENNGFGETSAIAALVNEINLYYDEPKLSKKYDAHSTSRRYAFIGFDSNGDVVIDSDDSIGGDAITSGMLYRPEKVSLDAVKIIAMPSQHGAPVVNSNGVIVKNYTDTVLESGDNYMRDSLAVTFMINQTGKKLTVTVNHLKSKGSTCVEDWDGVDFGDIEKLAFNKDKALLNKFGSNDDNQGNCENFRVAAAYQLGEELNKISGDKVIVGDMNSYAQEDPMLVLTENSTGKELKAARNTFIGRTPQFGENGKVITESYGYLNAVSMKDKEHKKTSWSYSYENYIGSLDHILITPTLKDRLVDATDWHINAAESALYDYNEDRKGDFADAFYANNAYRSSDHDSAIMVLGYKPAETDGAPVHIIIDGGLTNVPYVIPAIAGAQEGDVATITVSPITEGLDMSKMQVSPKILARSTRYVLIDGEKVYPLDLQPKLAILGLKAGEYSVSMSLARDGAPIAGSTVSFNIDVAKADSLEPKTVVPEYDNSGSGSFGIFSIMSLLGLGFLRHRKAK